MPMATPSKTEQYQPSIGIQLNHVAATIRASVVEDMLLWIPTECHNAQYTG